MFQESLKMFMLIDTLFPYVKISTIVIIRKADRGLDGGIFLCAEVIAKAT